MRLRPTRPLGIVLLASLAAASSIAAEAPSQPEVGWRDGVERALAEKEYEASPSGDGLQAPNRAHGLRTWFEPKGVRVVDRTAMGSPALLSLSLVRLGRGEALEPVPAGAVTHERSRVEIERPGLTEWYVNSAAGLEQGFTLAERPEGEGDLVLEVAVAKASVSGSADRLRLRTEAGRRLSFGKLHVEDAGGKAVPARFEPVPHGYRIVVEDATATYPLLIDPLLTASADSELESNQVDANLGVSVASAGDVNGDGFADVIAGAPDYDAGQTAEGAAFVFLGSAMGLADGNPINAHAQLESNQASADFGASVASAGDVNGDGYDDVIVGAPNYDNGHLNEGHAFLFHGGPSGIADANPATADARIESNQISAGFGGSSTRGGGVASAGDVNGDGYADVIVAAPGYDNGQAEEGVAFVFHGGATGLGHWSPPFAAAVLETDQAGASLGGVASAGDVNADGYADVIVCAGGYDNGHTNEGAAFVFLGGAAGVGNGNPANADALIESDGAEGIFDYDISCAGAGDVNGDGYADVVVGFPKYKQIQFHAGLVLVFHGGPAGVASGNAGDADSFFFDQQPGGLLGSSVASAGDVNGDGYADVIVGAYGYDGSQVDEGAAWVMLGSPTGVPTGIPFFVAWAELFLGEAGAQAGTSVASAGDVNGDGFDDVLVGAPFSSDPQLAEGRALLFLGGGTALEDGDPLTAHAQLESDQAGAWLGTSVSGAGDINGDGYGDVIVGARFYDAGEVNEGAAFLFLGSAAGIADAGPGFAHARLESDQVGAGFGRSVASAGDVNGDGYGDVIVGANNYDAGEVNEGAAFVFLGSAAGIADADADSAHARLESDQAGALLGDSAASAGDVNGDGYGDVIVGASGYDAGELNEGAAFLFLGSASGLANGDPGSAHARLESDQVSAFLGGRGQVASAGDVNGDGYGDIIVGASLYDAAEVEEGAAFLFLGSATGITNGDPGSAHARLESDQALAFFGGSVASAGDVNGDGYADVIVGAHGYAAGGFSGGAAFLFLGSAAGMPDGDAGSAHARLGSDQSSAIFGSSVASAGDVNGDGYADVIVGADSYDAGESDEGAAFLFLGGAMGIADASAANAAARLESDQAGGLLGIAVASAGDVNGDGFADVIVGASHYSAGEADEGAAFVFLGSPGVKTPAVPQQLRGDGSGVPIQPLGISGSATGFRVRLVAQASPRGRERGKPEIEFCPAGVAFGDPACNVERWTNWVDVATPAVFEWNTTSLTEGELYHWRARMLYAPFTVTEPGIMPPPNPRGGPWQRVQGKAMGGEVRVLPEPGVLGLVAGAGLLMGLARRRRRRGFAVGGSSR